MKSASGLARKLKTIEVPLAPIAKPWDLLHDPHLKASGGLRDTQIDHKTVRVPALPIELDGKRLGKRADPPRVREHARVRERWWRIWWNALW